MIPSLTMDSVTWPAVDSPSHAGTGICQMVHGEFPAATLRLAAVPCAAPIARRHVRLTLDTWGLDTLCDTAALLVSELVTNAIRASANGEARSREPGGEPSTITVSLARTGTGVAIEVWDASPTAPVVSEPDPLDEGGRGLFLVGIFCRGWGHYPADGGGKVVWCDLDVP